MPDESDTRAIDRTRVSLAEEREVAYWTQHFHVSRERLGEAMTSVGSATTAITRYFEKDPTRR